MVNLILTEKEAQLLSELLDCETNPIFIEINKKLINSPSPEDVE